MVFDFDDFGCSHVISDQCQSRDCRDKLIELREINPAFKVTLFAIPGEMTAELTGWCQLNRDWVEIAVHGFFHQTNYECEKLKYDDFDFFMRQFKDILKTCFVKGFKAPGWQISNDIYRWLVDNNYWVADQPYNDNRRPKELKSYVIRNNPHWHGHTWDCMGNGIYETFSKLSPMVEHTSEFQFVSEVVQ